MDKTDSLEIGDVIPVGDLFDVIADGDEPFTMASSCSSSRPNSCGGGVCCRSWKQHGVTWGHRAGKADPKGGCPAERCASP